MRKAENLFLGIVVCGLVVASVIRLWPEKNEQVHNDSVLSSQYGSFLAAQHAVYVNDFDSAVRFTQDFADVDNVAVTNVRILSDFLSGKMPDKVTDLKNEKSAPSRIIYDAYLAQHGLWDEMRKRHENDTSALMAPFKIWSSVATNYKNKTFKYIETLETNDAWKFFVRGQIYAQLGNIDDAFKAFQQVPVEFMNINDYLYIMSFYMHNNLSDAATALRSAFTATPGGMYMLDFKDVPDWSEYDGYSNQLAFSLLQTVSHTKVIMYSDLSLILLKFAQIIAPNANIDAVNYYIGQYMYNTHGNGAHGFNKIQKSSPFYPFTTVHISVVKDKTDVDALQSCLKAHPLFVPAIQKMLAYYIQNDNLGAALKVINRAIDNKNISDKGRAFFIKMRANVYYVFGDYKRAQNDIRTASDTGGIDGDIIMLQSKIWAVQEREIETAYEYAMRLIRQNPTDVVAWDTLGMVVYVREGVDAALEFLERVAASSSTCSSLFNHLGDMYVEIGEIDLARDAYNRALDLSSDGMVIAPEVSKKLRKLK